MNVILSGVLEEARYYGIQALVDTLENLTKEASTPR
jgi:hypothetical protein